jgi:hypothetical protein
MTKTTDAIRKGAKSVEERVYQTAARIERDAHQRTGAVGGLVKALEKAERELEKARGEIPRVEAEVREYLTRARDTITGTMRTARDRAIYLETTLFPDGEHYDADAARHMAKDMLARGEDARTIGQEAYETLQELCKGGSAFFLMRVHKKFPTMDELDSTYKGLGAKYQGVPTRTRLDASLEFYGRARKAIPNAVPLRREILQDIRDHAAVNGFDLSASLHDYKDPLADRKSDVIKRYHLGGNG